mmetsp:Transcript_18356/g.45504  ORF Transcript_18356/g.45504 Transcript_18356/m.45504 type:complete len:88 (+) Transcript_18356:1153-1416(+)
MPKIQKRLAWLAQKVFMHQQKPDSYSRLTTHRNPSFHHLCCTQKEKGNKLLLDPIHKMIELPDSQSWPPLLVWTFAFDNKTTESQWQ